jgi:TRAP-type mannitol/chloroaromatic compound transport system permease small subunit
MANQSHADAVQVFGPSDNETLIIILCRCFSWCMIGTISAFLLNNYLNYWRGWPSATSVFTVGASALGLVQVALYALALVLAVGYVLRTPGRPLRAESETIYGIVRFILRAGFWAVLLIGLADIIVSFLRVEGFLPGLFGEKMAFNLSRSSFRGTWVHFPMIAVGIAIAISRPRTLGFPWLALLVVAAELLIVISRFIFSYEQAFMADLVRFWYAALFLFASAYTLLEEGHVRVDVLYAGFKDQTKGIVNAVGSVVLGMTLCWVIIYYGMGNRAAIINSPLLSFEVTQTGFGLYVKYWMAGFLAIYAVTMLLQFSGYFLESIADFRGEPGKRQPTTGVAHETYET